MGRQPQYPNPKAKYHRGTWELYWNWNKKRYSLYPGRQDENDPEVEAERRRLAACLASLSPVFPPTWEAARGVQQYLADRFGISSKIDAESAIEPEATLTEYQTNLLTHCVKSWASNSMMIVKKLDAFVPGGIDKTSPQQAHRFLEAILAKGRSVGTRNRNLAMCSRYFNWRKANGFAGDNPFAAIKNMKEIDAENIVYCTQEERERVLAIAGRLNRPDWIAIPIAFFAGCRREEIFNLLWEDANLETRRIVIRKSKTGRKRLTPISKELLTILERHRQPHGHIVPRHENETWANQADRLVELVRESLCRPENPNLAGAARESVGKRRFLMTDADLRGLPKKLEALAKKMAKIDKAKPEYHSLALELSCNEHCSPKARDGGEWIPAERLGWNAWRHTFATLRVQAGVSLDKVTSWMGNTPVVCRKHYAQFMPRDGHDEDIDKE